MPEKMNILIEKGSSTVNVSYEDEDGRKIVKNVDASFIKALFYGSDQITESETVYPGVIKVVKTQNKERIWCYFPSHIKNITYDVGYGNKNFKICVPQTIWQFTFNKNSEGSALLVNTLVWTIDDGEAINMDTKLHKMPLNNYSETYTPGVCWGTYMRDINNMTKNGVDTFTLPRMYHLFFAGIFNNDLGLGSLEMSKIPKFSGKSNTPFDERFEDIRLSRYLHFLENYYLQDDPSYRANEFSESHKTLGDIIRIGCASM